MTGRETNGHVACSYSTEKLRKSCGELCRTTFSSVEKDEIMFFILWSKVAAADQGVFHVVKVMLHRTPLEGGAAGTGMANGTHTAGIQRQGALSAGPKCVRDEA